MPAVQLKLHRQWMRIAATVAILTSSLLLFRCGTDDKKKSDEKPPGLETVVPKDWNGSEDWTGSQWKATDE